ncbi:MAG: hypothetical protein JXM73_17040 [Anaerolineae bacterium]|nr:hypothetical protein [Anaerolineae bacterium]
MVACHLDPQEHIRLWHDEQSTLVGYATLDENLTFSWRMLPELEWAGIEA